MLLPKPFKVQPESVVTINKSHWIANRLTSVYVPAIGLGYDFLGKAVPIPIGNALSVAPTRGGKALAETSATNFSHGSKGVVVTSGFPIVMISYGYFTSSVNSWISASMIQSAVGASGENCTINLNSSTTIAYNYRTAFGTNAKITMTTGAGTNTGQLFCMMSMSLSATDHRFYIDGVEGTSATNSGAPTNQYDQFSIGGNASTGLAGGIVYCAYGHKAFTAQECIQITRDPTLFWGMFNDYGTWPINSVSAGGSLIKLLNTIAIASVKTRNGVDNSSIKTINTITNV